MPLGLRMLESNFSSTSIACTRYMHRLLASRTLSQYIPQRICYSLLPSSLHQQTIQHSSPLTLWLFSGYWEQGTNNILYSRPEMILWEIHKYTLWKLQRIRHRCLYSRTRGFFQRSFTPTSQHSLPRFPGPGPTYIIAGPLRMRLYIKRAPPPPHLRMIKATLPCYQCC